MGVRYRFTKSVGIFTDYSYGKFYNNDRHKIKLGLALTFWKNRSAMKKNNSKPNMKTIQTTFTTIILVCLFLIQPIHSQTTEFSRKLSLSVSYESANFNNDQFKPYLLSQNPNSGFVKHLWTTEYVPHFTFVQLEYEVLRKPNQT